MFKKITSLDNIRQAYNEVFELFYLEGKANRYKGLDGLNLNSFNLSAFDLIKQIRNEMINFVEIDPALNIYIPKKHKPEKDREIFIYNIKERIKAQAIYRCLFEIFDARFSDRLFSYRPGKSPYRAAQLVCRKYRKSFKDNYVFTADLSNFSGEIDRALMIKKLSSFIEDKSVLKLLELFINARFYFQGGFLKPQRGLVIGCPVFGLLTNFYLSEIDFKYSARSKFYLRLGDDLIMIDPDLQKLEKNKKEFLEDVSSLKLKINLDKIFLGKASDHFSYLGYDFSNGLISLPDDFVKRFKHNLNSLLVNRNNHKDYKIKIIKRLMKNPQKNFNNIFKEIVRIKPQINDVEQIKALSEYFFRALTEFLFNKYNSRNRRLLALELVKNKISIISLYKTYLKFHYERG